LASCAANPQSNTLCPGYNPNPQTNTASNSPTRNTVSTDQPTTRVSDTGRVETGVAIVSDSNVNQVITRQSASADAGERSAPVNVTRQESPQQSTPTAPTAVAAKQEQKQEQKAEQKQEQKAEDKPSGGGSTQTAQSSQSSGDSKPAPQTARQAIQERREAAARAKAVEDGKNLAGNMGKVADMEQQKQIQNVVIAAMGFTPGFDAYGKTIVPDAAGYKPFTVYSNQRTVDNRSALRMFGGTDNLHREMVDSQYNR